MSPARRDLTINAQGDVLHSAIAEWGQDDRIVEATVEQWAEHGQNLGRVEQLVAWEVGDWWNRGERWGNRVDIVSNPDWKGPSYQTCRNYGAVAAKFPVYRRRYSLSFSLHAELVRYDIEEADRQLDDILKKVEATGKPPSVKAVRQIVKREKRDQREQELGEATREASIKLGQKRYGVIYADPPWQFEPYSRETGMDRSAENHYGCLETDAICAMEIPAAEDCVLFLWRTAAMNEDALKVMRSWGFKYKSEWIWGKPKKGTGYWSFNQHEVLMIGTRGRPVAPAPGQQPASLQILPVGRHSEKPLVFHRIIEKMFPHTPKIDMFARKFRRGWDAFGNELPAELPEDNAQAAE